MPSPELVYRWDWQFTSSPEALWPLVSDTDRFNRDCGFPAVTAVPLPPAASGVVTNLRRVRTKVLGTLIEWDEEPFEWTEPFEFRVRRKYLSGPVASMDSWCALSPRAGGGTAMIYELRLVPSGIVGRLSIPLAIGRSAKKTIERVFRKYDRIASAGERLSPPATAKLASGAPDRLAAARTALIAEAGQRADLVDRLADLICTGDELTLGRIRCYAAADEWGAGRRDTLSLFLHATRAGLLNFSWDVVCPHCRGAKQSEGSLSGIKQVARCDSCDIDFDVDFDQSVELTFSPNPSIRSIVRADFCVGGPQVTPHVVAQFRVEADIPRVLSLDLRPGGYRLRPLGKGRQHPFKVAEDGIAEAEISLGEDLAGDLTVRPGAKLTIRGAAAVAAIEHVSWTDQATSAAEVTALQVFRDLFSREVLRPGENISVGSMCIVFTDLKNSTQMYRQIGDGPAFGRVLSHFDVLRSEVAANGGAIVKTMGDAVMAVFPHPLDGLLAVTAAARKLRELGHGPEGKAPLLLKAGLHFGPCLAINQNDHLDYFGTSVNLAARLCGLCTGSDFVLSPAAASDAAVANYLNQANPPFGVRADRALLNGFGSEPVEILRLTGSS